MFINLLANNMFRKNGLKNRVFYPVFFYALFLISNVLGQSACTVTVDAGNNIAICSPSILQLNGSTSATGTNIRSISWTPISGLNNPTILTPTAAVSAPITYRLSVTALSDSNMVVNGNFDAGISGFTTAYALGTGGTYGLLSDAATYAISTNPRLTHTNFAIFGDHTTGTGNMMVINGDTASGNLPLICQTIPVTPYTDYDFSIWAATCVSSSPATLSLQINGFTIGSPLILPLATGVWTQLAQSWNSGPSTSATLCLVDQNAQVSGNDFAIDDFSLREICTVQDSMSVTIGAIGIMDLGDDTTLCTGQSTILNATVTNATRYRWNTTNPNDTLPTLPVNTSGQYIATASIGGLCPTSDTMNVLVKAYPILAIPPDTSFCLGNTVQLDATASFATSYLWNDGVTSPVRNVSNAGNFSVIASNGNCKSYDTTVVTTGAAPVFTLGNDTSLCLPDSIVLTAPFLPNVNYTWYDGSHAFTNIITTPGTYWLEGVDGGCLTREYLYVAPGDCGSVFIPNVFTPNGDGKNDTWQIYQYSVVSITIRIFNRWGEQVFTSDKLDFAWNGLYKNRACTQGVYFYVLDGFYPSGDTFKYKGSVTLLK